MIRRIALSSALLAGCAAGHSATASPRAGSEAGQVEAFARQCIEAEPERYTSLGGSPLVPEKARAVRRFGAPSGSDFTYSLPSAL